MESDVAPVVKKKELPIPGEEVAAEEISAPMEEVAAIPATSPVEELPAPIEESAAGKEEPTVVTKEAREAPSEEEKVADVVHDGEKAGALGALNDEATLVSEVAVPVAEEKYVPTATEEEMAVAMQEVLVNATPVVEERELPAAAGEEPALEEEAALVEEKELPAAGGEATIEEDASVAAELLETPIEEKKIGEVAPDVRVAKGRYRAHCNQTR